MDDVIEGEDGRKNIFNKFCLRCFLILIYFYLEFIIVIVGKILKLNVLKLFRIYYIIWNLVGELN